MDEITILQAEVLKTLANPRRLEILHEVHLSADAGVDTRADRIGDHLAGQIDLDGRVDRDHPMERPDDRRVIREIDRAHLHHRVVVDEVVQPLRSEDERRHDLAPITLLGITGHGPGLDKVDH